jgi:ribosomal protein L11 methyltransferase
METRCPYENLYIYLLDGWMKREDEALLGKGFVGNWVEDGTCFLFFSRPANDVVAHLLEIRSNLKLLEQYEMPYEQWQGGMLEPMHVGEFSIVTPWGPDVAGEGRKTIILDPGVVFGNGLHPTTRDCLRAVSFVRKEFAFKRVLDLGTGTGILAVASGLLGAEQVLAVDLNSLCARTALKNVLLNHVEGTVEVLEDNALEVLPERTDLVIANIHYEVIKELLGKDHFRQISRIIISGLMRSQARQVREDLRKYEIPVLREWEHEMTWYTILAGGRETHD